MRCRSYKLVRKGRCGHFLPLLPENLHAGLPAPTHRPCDLGGPKQKPSNSGVSVAHGGRETVSWHEKRCKVRGKSDETSVEYPGASFRQLWRRYPDSSERVRLLGRHRATSLCNICQPAQSCCRATYP